MSKKQSYQETDYHLIGQQLPDEDMAWADMQQRLDKDTRRRRLPLPPMLQGCGLWLLTGILLMAVGIWYWQNEEEEQREPVSSSIIDQRENQSSTNVILPEKSTSIDITINESNSSDSSLILAPQVSTPLSMPMKSAAPSLKRRSATTRNVVHQEPVNGMLPHKKDNARVLPTSTIKQTVNHSDIPDGGENGLLLQRDNFPVLIPVSIKQTGSLKPSLLEDVMDSLNNDSLMPQITSKKWIAVAGVAGQQQIPLAGQSATPYNYLGRKGSLADYIPSAYLQLYSGKKWFLQTEFKFGAPQHTKEFVYTSKVIKDTLGVQTRASYRLKKTYYHQLPIGLHYNVSPGFSIGTGMVMNKFFGAISEQEIRQQVNPFSDTLLSKGIVRDKSDSLFRSTFWQWFVETQYRYKRLSIGARYASGIQPFIEYNNALGELRKEKNHSLQLFLRYELWRSGR